MFRKLVVITISMIIVINFTACTKPQKKRYEATFLMLFDTVTQIVAYTDSEDHFAEQSQLIYDSLEEYHQLYDIYHDYEGINNIKTINDQAGIVPVKVDKRIIDLLNFAKKTYQLTDGKINIAFGPVLKIWHDYRIEGMDNPERAALPLMSQLKKAAAHTDINKIIINEENSTVFLEDSDMRLDIGAVAKGYAVKEVSQIAIEYGFTSGLISVGGNVCAVGIREDSNTPWQVGVQNPIEQNGENVSKVSLTDASLVTSGINERYYTVNGKNYHHIINPETLFPAEYFASVTILCTDSGLADALSTAVFNMPFEQGSALIESLPDTEALWVFYNGEKKYSSNFVADINEHTSLKAVQNNAA